MRQKRSAGFTLVELLVCIAILATLVSLLLPAIQKVREAASRASCANNLKQLALGCLNHESSFGSLPRGGEHLLYWNGSLRKTQDQQSWLTMILPFVGQGNLADSYNEYARYNATPANQAVAANVVKTFLCPSNPFADERVGGRASGYGCTDYISTIYTNISVNGTENAGDAFLMAGALLGSPYPTNCYAEGGSGATIASNKRLQLVLSVNPRQGGAAMSLMRDGESNTWMLGECVGASEVNIATAGGYWDPVTGGAQLTWPWASPDASAAGISKRINNNDGTRSQHDCANNSELWGKGHFKGVNIAYVDGSVRFVSDSTPTYIIRAMVTRAGGETYGLED